MKEYAYIHEEGNIPESLQNVPFLQSFSSSQIDELLHSSSILECEPGDAVIAEGESESRIFILMSGDLEVIKGTEVIATSSEVGDIFGELSAIDDEVRSASVVAKTKSFCLAVDQKFLQDIMPESEHPEFYMALYRAVARIAAARLKATSAELARVEKELQALKGE